MEDLNDISQTVVKYDVLRRNFQAKKIDVHETGILWPRNFKSDSQAAKIKITVEELVGSAEDIREATKLRCNKLPLPRSESRWQKAHRRRLRILPKSSLKAFLWLVKYRMSVELPLHILQRAIQTAFEQQKELKKTPASTKSDQIVRYDNGVIKGMKKRVSFYHLEPESEITAPTYKRRKPKEWFTTTEEFCEEVKRELPGLGHIPLHLIGGQRSGICCIGH